MVRPMAKVGWSGIISLKAIESRGPMRAVTWLATCTVGAFTPGTVATAMRAASRMARQQGRAFSHMPMAAVMRATGEIANTTDGAFSRMPMATDMRVTSRMANNQARELPPLPMAIVMRATGEMTISMGVAF